MTYSEIKNILSNLTVHKSKRMIYLKNHNPQIYDSIINLTKFLDITNKKNDNISFQERIYCIEHDIYDRPKCINCKTEYVYFRKDENRYRDFCSSKCSKSSSQTREKRESTLTKRYGNKNFNNFEKSRITRETKNNGKWHSDDFIKKVKDTNLKLHGDENWNNKEKFSKTNEEKYGVKYVLQLNEVQEKCRESFKKNHPGCNSTMDIPECREKITIGIKERSWNFILNNSLVTPNFTKDEYIKCKNTKEDNALEFICKNCGNVFKSYWDDGMCKPCPKCHPELKGQSKMELEVVDFLKNTVGRGWTVLNKTEENSRLIEPKEIDIIVKDENNNICLLIEFDGLYYHGEISFKRDRNYHLNKTEECEKLGYQLIHIFENEWISKRDIVKSRILNLLGKYEKTVYARKCTVKELKFKEVEKFLITNHIQGSCMSSINLGLMYDNEIVSVMTFSKSRITRKYEWELLRFCNRTGYHVVGGASKLLKYFERKYQPKSMVSYADRRWSVGKLYKSIGFTHIHNSLPNYWYFKQNNTSVIYSRMKFQKHKQKNILSKFDGGLSESENMRNNGYDRIFDCGNMVFVKEY